MPESPLSPAAARQTPASSLLSHTDNGTGDGADSCSGDSGDNWPSLHHKQVPSSSRRPPNSTVILHPLLLVSVEKKKRKRKKEQSYARQGKYI